MKYNELKKRFQKRFVIRIAAGVLTIALLGAGVGYSAYAQAADQKTSQEENQDEKETRDMNSNKDLESAKDTNDAASKDTGDTASKDAGDTASKDTQEEVLSKVLSKQVDQEKKNAGKEETVYVVADASGKKSEVIVSEWLKNMDGSETIKDASDLTNIKNVKGDEEYTRGKGDEITWKAGGSDIYYQGETKKELPVDLKITYSLDGKEMSAREIAGKSGKVKIRMDYSNKEKKTVEIGGKQEEIYVPFTAISGMMLSDKFSNVEVTNGKLISDGKNQVVVGLAMPGLAESLQVESEDFETDVDIPDYVEVTADVEDFSLDMTMTMVMSDALSELNINDSLDLSKLEDSIDDLSDASGQLVNGAGELSKGTDTLSEKSGDLKSGVETLKDGIISYTDGVSQVADGTAELKEKSGALIAGVNTLSEGVNTISESFSSEKGLVNGSNAVSEGVGKLDASLKTPVSEEEKGTIHTQVQEQFAAGGDESKNAQIAAQTKKALTDGAAGSVNEALTQSFYQVLYQAVLSQYADAIANGLVTQEQAQAAADQAASAQVAQMGDSISGLTSQIVEGIADQAGSAVAANCADAYAQGMVSGIDYAKGTIASQMESGGLISGAAELSAGVSKLYTEGITPLKEGVDSLVSNIPALTGGIDQLAAGAGALKENSGTLQNGAEALKTGTSALVDGIGQIDDGARKLDEGMVEFDKEGIKKLADTYHGDVKSLLDRIDAVMNAGKSYHSFTKLADGVEGSVKFMIRTEAVKAE